jgi:hypothetical protein
VATTHSCGTGAAHGLIPDRAVTLEIAAYRDRRVAQSHCHDVGGLEEQ